MVHQRSFCPGDIWPGMRHMTPPGGQHRDERGGPWPVPPIGRIGQAPDVAAAVFYASSQAASIRGTTLLIDGGMTVGYLQRERTTPGPSPSFSQAHGPGQAGTPHTAAARTCRWSSMRGARWADPGR